MQDTIINKEGETSTVPRELYDDGTLMTVGGAGHGHKGDSHIGAEGLNRRPPAGSCRLFLGPGFRLAARWNRLVETVKTRKKREKTGGKWARYDLKGVKDGS